MRDKRFWFGTTVSIGWLVLIALVILQKRADAASLKLNEWGDLFAGAVAPLAFLWLILGFLQQGEELQLNTKALELQAEELSKSVEHQRQMVEISRKQLEGEIETAKAERAAQREAARPKLAFLGGGGSFSGLESNYDLTFQNVGNTATELRLYVDPPPVAFRPTSVPVLSRGDSIQSRISFHSPPIEPIKLTISYLDSSGTPGDFHYLLSRDISNPHSVFSAVPTNGA